MTHLKSTINTGRTEFQKNKAQMEPLFADLKAKAEVIKLIDLAAAPYESGNILLSPLNGDPKMDQKTAGMTIRD